MKIRRGDKLYSYLERNPQDYDVVFLIGRENQPVKGLKVLLKSTSTVFEDEFNKKWDRSKFQKENGDGIPFPDLDPLAFKTFMKLIITDHWSVEGLSGLKFETLLYLMSMCRKFGMSNEMHVVQEVVDELIPLFESFVKTREFLRLSQSNLEAILSSDLIPMDEANIFEHILKWASHQCQEQNLELNGENLRQILGGCLFQIRFPIMKACEFKKCIRHKHLLTTEEISEIFSFISRDEEQEQNFESESSDQLPFKTKPRTKEFKYTTLTLTKGCKIVHDHGFVCDGHWPYDFTFKANRRIALQSIGFLGPIEADATYHVEIEIAKIDSFFSRTHSSGRMEKKVHAKKGQVFHFVLDHPITLDSITSDSLFDDVYSIRFSLAGPNTLRAVKESKTFGQGSVIMDKETGFILRWNGHQCGDQIAEIRFMEL